MPMHLPLCLWLCPPLSRSDVSHSVSDHPRSLSGTRRRRHASARLIVLKLSARALICRCQLHLHYPLQLPVMRPPRPGAFPERMWRCAWLPCRSTCASWPDTKEESTLYNRTYTLSSLQVARHSHSGLQHVGSALCTLSVLCTRSVSRLLAGAVPGALVAPGAPKPSKLLLQYSVWLLLRVDGHGGS